MRVLLAGYESEWIYLWIRIRSMQKWRLPLFDADQRKKQRVLPLSESETLTFQLPVFGKSRFSEMMG